MKRNGKIEIMRFVFCMFVFLYHIGGDFGIRNKLFFGYFTFFANGRNGVEFFFLLSGFFCAKSAYSLIDSKTGIGESTYDFMKKKILSVLPFHIICSFVIIVIYAVYREDFTDKLFNYIPNLLFLQRSGMPSSDLISVEWYICSMLFALIIIFPMLRKNFDLTAYVIAPGASAILIGYLIKKYKHMPGIYDFEGITYACNIRALAVMLLGVFCFAICQKIRNGSFPRYKRLALIGVENFCWLCSLCFIVYRIESKYDGLFIYSTAVAITLCLSRDFTTPLYQNKLVMLLGKLSLPVYLGQNIIRHIYNYTNMDMRLRYAVLFMVIGAVLTGMIILAFTEKLSSINLKYNKKTLVNNA